MSTPLSEIFNPTGASPEPATQPDPEPEVTEPEAPDPDKAENAEPEAPKADEPKEPESSPDSDAKTVPVAAMHGERERRQAAEKRLKELEDKLAESEKEQPKEERVSIFEDEDKAVSQIEKRIEERINARLYQSGEKRAIKEHGEDLVKEAVAWAEDAATKFPSIAQSFAGVGMDGLHEKAVELYEAELKRQELADPDALRKKIEAEVREQIAKEQEEAEAAKAKKRDSIPKSLTGDDSKGSLKGSDWSGPTPLESILKK